MIRPSTRSTPWLYLGRYTGDHPSTMVPGSASSPSAPLIQVGDWPVLFWNIRVAISSASRLTAPMPRHSTRSTRNETAANMARAITRVRHTRASSAANPSFPRRAAAMRYARRRLGCRVGRRRRHCGGDSWSSCVLQRERGAASRSNNDPAGPTAMTSPGIGASVPGIGISVAQGAPERCEPGRSRVAPLSVVKASRYQVAVIPGTGVGPWSG